MYNLHTVTTQRAVQWDKKGSEELQPQSFISSLPMVGSRLQTPYNGYDKYEFFPNLIC